MPLQFDKISDRDRYAVQRDELAKFHGRTAQPNLMDALTLNTPVDRQAVREAHDRCEDDHLNDNTYEPRYWKDVLLDAFGIGRSK